MKKVSEMVSLITSTYIKNQLPHLRSLSLFYLRLDSSVCILVTAFLITSADLANESLLVKGRIKSQAPGGI